MQIQKRLRPWMLVSAVWIAPAALAIVSRVAQRRLQGEPPATTQDLLWAGGDWLVYAFLTPIIFWIANRWPVVAPHIARRTLFHLGISLLFCAAWATSGKILQAILALIHDPNSVRAAAGSKFWWQAGRDWLSWVFTTLPFGVVVYLTVAGMAHAIRYFVEAGERKVQLARLSEQLSSARFSALQAQLNPHFLFNTLNTVTVLVRDGDRAGATQMVEALSDILRRTLNRHRANEVTLAEELDLVRQYLAIEQARFSDRLRPGFEIDDALLSAAVPSFMLQHLVENAIRHGIAKRSDAGRVNVRARRDLDVLEISVIDDGAGIESGASDAKGHGIDSTKERLRALYGGRAKFEIARGATGGTVAKLHLPYREMEAKDAEK